MAVHGRLFGICNVVGQFRNILLNRNTMPFCQPNIRFKQTVEEKLGLPAKPKKPLSAFFRFMAEMRPVILQKNPNMKLPDVAKSISKEWEKVDDKVKQRLENEFKQEMEQYVVAYQDYEMTLTPADREEIKAAKLEIKEAKEKRILRKKKKELGKPRRPVSPFLVFMSENKEKKGNLAFSEWQKHMSNEWKKMPEGKKSQYLANFKKSNETYQREMRDWEEKMIRLGHIDLVRNEALIEPKSPAKRASRRIEE